MRKEIIAICAGAVLVAAVVVAIVTGKANVVRVIFNGFKGTPEIAE